MSKYLDREAVLLSVSLYWGFRANGADDVLVVVGGTIPQDDADELKAQGVAGVFGPGSTTSEIVDFLRGAVAV